MITACKAYITDSGCETVWSQEMPIVIRKLKDCIRLNEEYQSCFHKTKAKLEQMPNERQFEFSEMYIFGKFDTFTRRLKKIIEMFDTMEMYSHLADSKIEGMEQMTSKFQVIVTQMKKKPYDYLDQRKTEFDADFEDFKRQIGELHVSTYHLCEFIFLLLYTIFKNILLMCNNEQHYGWTIILYTGKSFIVHVDVENSNNNMY